MERSSFLIRYTPPFILYNLERGKQHGSFPGFVMFFDIVDFTTTCDLLQKEGKRGAEEISKLMQTILREPLLQVEKNGGYVIRFVGDAFLAVFREQAAQNVLAATFAISNHFQQMTEYSSPLGTFPIKFRLLVSFGKISWRIFANEMQNEYIFRGRVIQELHRLSKRKSGLVFTEEAVWKIGRSRFSKKGSKYEPVKQGIETHPDRLKYRYSPQTANSFLHVRIHKMKPENEIRLVACCFVNMEPIIYEKRPGAVSDLQQLAVQYGGFVNKLAFGDKGLIALILFGIPRNDGDIHTKACRFALEAAHINPALSFGIASGELFAGYIGSDYTREYTALGHPINLAARLLEISKPGEIICSSDILKEAGKTFVFEHYATNRLKGISTAVKSYKLNKVLAGHRKKEPSRFVGREKEKAWLRKMVRDTFTGNRNTVIYIRGDAGIGKTRLVNEALRSFYGSKYYIIMMKCELLIPKPLFADKRFIRSFYGLNEEDMNSSGLPIFQKKWTAWAEGKQEILDLEPMLAAYLGLISYDILKKEHPELLQPEKQISGWLTFLRELASRRQLLLFIDDIQRIDPMSREYLVQMSKAGIRPICLIMNYTPEENQEYIDLNLENYTSHVLELGPLSIDDSLRLYADMMGVTKLPADTSKTLRTNTRGNPLHIQQLSTFLLESGWNPSKDSLLRDLDARKHPGVISLMGQYVDRLPHQTMECAYYASVLGIRFEIPVLTSMLGCDPTEDLLIGVENLIWKDEGDGSYVFSHALTQQTIYNRMMSGKLAEVHLKAAHALEKIHKKNLDQHAEEITRHYQKVEELISIAQEERDPANIMRSKRLED